MTSFTNPANGYREKVSEVSGWLAFFFGVFYFLIKGLWTHVAIQILIIVGSLASLGPGGVFIVLVMWISYAFAVRGILESRYRRRGWIEGDGDWKPPSPPKKFQTDAAALPNTRECPRCAETVKAAAKVCRFCGCELAPTTPPAEPVNAVNPLKWTKTAVPSAVEAVTTPVIDPGAVVYHPNKGEGRVANLVLGRKAEVLFSDGPEIVPIADLTTAKPSA